LVFARLAGLIGDESVSDKERRNAVLSGSTVVVFRGLSLIIGLLLAAWAFSDDVRIVGGPGFGATQALLLGIGVINILAIFSRVSWLAALIVFQISLGATLVASELLLKSTLYPRYYSPYQLEPRYLYNLIPGARRENRVIPVNGGSNVYEVNSLGFRGPEIPRDRSATPRIAIYGDSFIHAEFTALDKTLPRQLQSLLTAETGSEVEVINAGVAGYGPDQVLRRMEDELTWLQPDLVIVSVFSGNDFGDLVRNKLYRLRPDGSITENDYVFSDEVVLHAELERSEFILKKLMKEVRDIVMSRVNKSAPFDPAASIVSGLEQHLAEYREYVVDGNSIVSQLRSDPYSADISLLPGSPSADYKLKLMDGVIGRIVAVAEKHEVPLLFLIIPHPMDVLGGAHASGVIDLAAYPEYSPERLTGSIQAIVDSHGADHINLYPWFRDADDPAALFLKAGDDHWNNAGQRYAAEIIAQRLGDEPAWRRDREASR